VPDLISFIAAVFAISRCPVRVSFYLKHFMAEYHAEVDWTSLLLAETELKGSYIWSSTHPGPELEYAWWPGKPKRSRVAARQAPAALPMEQRPRGKRGQRAGGSGNSAGGRKRTKSAKACNSRKSVAGVCARGEACHFSHDCMSCGANHAASSCPSWDQSRVDAALRRQ
jgi:hypothetical protein